MGLLHQPPDVETPGSPPFSLAGEEAKPGGIGSLDRRLSRYASARKRTLSTVRFLRTSLKPQDSSGKCCECGEEFELEHARKIADRLECCGEWLHFRHYYNVDELRLVQAQFCQLTKLCPLCAIRRGAKNLQAYLERFVLVNAEMPGLLPYMITLTVRNGPDLKERMSHLRKAVKRAIDRRRQARSGNKRGKTQFAKIEGAVGSFEITNKGNGWHPHLHLIALCSEEPDLAKLKAEWEKSTGDSFICDIRPLEAKPGEVAPIDAFCEVFKYAMKFQDMSHEDNWRAYLQLRGVRLLVSFGCFYGVPEPPELSDKPLEDEPYVDLFFRYLSDSGVYSYNRIGETDPAAATPRKEPGQPLIKRPAGVGWEAAAAALAGSQKK